MLTLSHKTYADYSLKVLHIISHFFKNCNSFYKKISKKYTKANFVLNFLKKCVKISIMYRSAILNNCAIYIIGYIIGKIEAFYDKFFKKTASC